MSDKPDLRGEIERLTREQIEEYRILGKQHFTYPGEAQRARNERVDAICDAALRAEWIPGLREANANMLRANNEMEERAESAERTAATQTECLLDAEQRAQVAEQSLAQARALLTDALEFIEDYEDVNKDGDGPNAAMSLAGELRQALGESARRAVLPNKEEGL